MDIGIIGGADGPTAIFITSSVNWPYVALAAVLIAGGCAFFLIRRRKGKNAR